MRSVNNRLKGNRGTPFAIYKSPLTPQRIPQTRSALYPPGYGGLHYPRLGPEVQAGARAGDAGVDELARQHGGIALVQNHEDMAELGALALVYGHVLKDYVSFAKLRLWFSYRQRLVLAIDNRGMLTTFIPTLALGNEKNIMMPF